MPDVVGCYAFYEEAEQSLRGFYVTHSGYRLSIRANINTHGKENEVLKVLKWCWQSHKELAGMGCPMIGLIMVASGRANGNV